MAATVSMFYLIFNLVFSKQCNVLDYGAKGDAITLDTRAIQYAIDNCSFINNTDINSVIFPLSYNFLTYPFTISSNNIQLQIDATITAPMDYINWPHDLHAYQTFISFKYDVSNIKITGNGLINVNGYFWYPLYLNNTLKYRRPTTLTGGFINSEISNITFLNPPMWCMLIKGINLTIHNINITVVDNKGNPGNWSVAPNTDGIDISGSNVHIYDCYVQNGDDSFTLESGSDNILIENSTCSYGLGLGLPMACDQLGEPRLYDTINSIYRNIITYKTWYGIRIKSCGNRGNLWNGTVYNITYENITFIDVLNGIDINVYNQSVDDELDSFGYSNISNVIFKDIKGTFTDWVGHLDCSFSPPCRNLHFENINLKMDSDNGNDNWICSDNVYGSEKNVTPPINCLQLS